MSASHIFLLVLPVSFTFYALPAFWIFWNYPGIVFIFSILSFSLIIRLMFSHMLLTAECARSERGASGVCASHPGSTAVAHMPISPAEYQCTLTARSVRGQSLWFQDKVQSPGLNMMHGHYNILCKETNYNLHDYSTAYVWNAKYWHIVPETHVSTIPQSSGKFRILPWFPQSHIFARTSRFFGFILKKTKFTESLDNFPRHKKFNAQKLCKLTRRSNNVSTHSNEIINRCYIEHWLATCIELLHCKVNGFYEWQ